MLFQEVWAWLLSRQYTMNSGNRARANCSSIWDSRRMSKTSALGCQSSSMRLGSVLCSILDVYLAHWMRMCWMNFEFSSRGTVPRSRQ